MSDEVVREVAVSDGDIALILLHSAEIRAAEATVEAAQNALAARTLQAQASVGAHRPALLALLARVKKENGLPEDTPDEAFDFSQIELSTVKGKVYVKVGGRKDGA